MKRQPLLGIFATAGAFFLLNRWGTRWGATPDEVRQSFPGDEIIPHPDLELTNAITIRAPAKAIWPWLVQLGYYRGGWHTDSTWRDWDYIPDKILRFFVRQEARQSGYRHRDAPTDPRIIPEFQQLEAGGVVLDGPPGTAYFTVAAIEPNQSLVYHSNSHLRFLFPRSIRENPKIGVGGEFSWAFYLQDAGDENTRLVMRTRGVIRPGWYRVFIQGAVPIANLFLAKKMIGGIKKTAEGADGNREFSQAPS